MAGKQRMRLSDASIARLRPRAREYAVWDTRIAGLGVRVRPSGSASFVLLTKTDKGSMRLSLGPVAARGIDDVRRQCHALMAEPQAQHTSTPAHDMPVFRDFVAGPWRDVCYSSYKPSTRKGVRCALATQLLPAFGATPLDSITRVQLSRWFSAYSQGAPGGANYALRVLRQILNFAIARGHIESNPTRGMRLNRLTPRTRFLSQDEIRRLHRALDEQSRQGPVARQEADIVRLLLLTGCRKTEISKLRWCEVQGDSLALGETKTGPRKVPLNAQAQRIIACQPRGTSAFVFPSPRNAARPRGAEIKLWETVRRQAGIDDVRIHDLRHNLASHAVMNGVPVPVVSRLLGHSNVRMTLRYAHLTGKDIEAAAERIGEALARLMASKPHPR